MRDTVVCVSSDTTATAPTCKCMALVNSAKTKTGTKSVSAARGFWSAQAALLRRANKGRTEAVNGRQPRDAGVRKALRHDQESDCDSSRHVLRQPRAPLIALQPRHARQQTRGYVPRSLAPRLPFERAAPRDCQPRGAASCWANQAYRKSQMSSSSSASSSLRCVACAMGRLRSNRRTSAAQGAQPPRIVPPRQTATKLRTQSQQAHIAARLPSRLYRTLFPLMELAPESRARLSIDIARTCGIRPAAMRAAASSSAHRCEQPTTVGVV